MSIEVVIGAVAAVVSLGAGLLKTFMQRNQTDESITVVTVNQRGRVIEVFSPVEPNGCVKRDPFYDLQRSRLRRIQNGESVTAWDETIEKAAAASLEEQRQRFGLLLGLRS